MPLKLIHDFLRLEAASGILLFFMAILAIVCNNSALSPYYQNLWQLLFELNFTHYQLKLPLVFVINDGLMAIFFLMVGLELKRAFYEGELSGVKKILLPWIAAVGGMLLPGCIFLFINPPSMITHKGWAIPMATDIAFALGVLSLFGRKVPIGLKLFLMALAVFDDIGAICIIALFYSHDISIFYFFMSLFVLLLLWLCQHYLKIIKLAPYLILGTCLWICVFKTGIHPTVAGVLLAFMIPLNGPYYSPLKYLEKKLHPWVAYFILPTFAFANAGLSFSGLSLSVLLDPLTLGIMSGLFIGKTCGVFAFAWACIKVGWAKLPRRCGWPELLGVATLCGIGFTMSLFLGTLAFQNHESIYLTEIKLGVLLGSILSGIGGALILHLAFWKNVKKET